MIPLVHNAYPVDIIKVSFRTGKDETYRLPVCLGPCIGLGR